MDHNGIKSINIYFEYVDLISLLSEEEQAYLYLKIINYIFYDEEPDNLTNSQKKVWSNLLRPITKSKKQSLRAFKRWEETSNEINTNTYANSNANNDANNDAHQRCYMSNVNNLEVNRGMGEEENFVDVTDDVSSLKEITETIISELNTKAGTKYRVSSKTTQTKINARLNDGYTLNDFLLVIDNKCADWLGTEYEKYLCPETLFGPKFEKYLNQKSKQSKKKNPNWFDKKIDSVPLNPMEQKELEDIIRAFD